MSNEPVIRLIALNSDNADEATEILFPDGVPVSEKGVDAIEAAIAALTETVEDAICRGADEVLFDLRAAELLAIELKRRKRKRGHPTKSGRAQILREATLRYAEDLAKAFRGQGHGVEKARSLAADKASARAAKSGDHVAASTIERQMKEAAAARREEEQSRGKRKVGPAVHGKPSR